MKNVMMLILVLGSAAVVLFSGSVRGQTHRMVEYRSGDTILEGYLVLPKQVRSAGSSGNGCNGAG